ncbi:MAG: transposase [Candidatus Omnitrophota bacterium]
MQNLKTRKLNRLKDYDYSLEGYYFVTICSRNREIIFGEYTNNVGTALAAVRNNIKLTKLGQIIDSQWNDLPNQYKNIELDQYIIMPNHLHGILIINKRTGASPVPTISNIIGSLKSKISVEYLQYINNENLNVCGQIWQRSFHDHIIRNDKSLNKIRNYITTNPENWENDIDNLINL